MIYARARSVWTSAITKKSAPMIASRVETTAPITRKAMPRTRNPSRDLRPVKASMAIRMPALPPGEPPT